MSLFGRVRKLSPLAALAVAAGIGCSADRDVWMTQVGDFLFEFPVDGSAAEGRPSGEHVVGSSVLAPNLGHPDIFGRMVEGTFAGYTDGGTFQVGWLFNQADARNATTDPRLPAIASTTAALAGLLVMGDPATSGSAGFHNAWTPGQFTGLEPNTTYIVALYRYGLQVNGELDHINAALGEPIANPDQLVPLGGAPRGDPTVAIVTFPTVVPVQEEANPFVLGQFTTGGAGTGFFDVVIHKTSPEGNDILYHTAGGDPSAAAMDSALVARNDTVATTFPRYNYLVLLEGSATTAAEAAALPQALRIQMGTDLDAATGEPVRNAYAPFPTPMSQAQLLAAPGIGARADSLVVTFNNMAQLAGATYQVWLVNRETGTSFSPLGNWSATMLDPDDDDDPQQIPVGSETDVRTFVSEGHWNHTFVTSDAIAGRAIGEFTDIVISIEAAEANPEGAPAPAQPIWARFTNMGGEPDDPAAWTLTATAPVNFGSLNFSTTPPFANPIPFINRPETVGRGHFWGTADDDQFRVRVRDINRPPVGFFFEGWLVPEDGRGAPFSLGSLTTGPEDGFASLRDVDTQIIGSFVRTDRILDALQLVRIGDLGVAPWHLAEYHLKLAPKARAEILPPYTVLGGFIPDAVQRREP